MAVNPAIQNMIRDGKTFQIDNVIYGSAASQAMLSMDNELIRLAKEGRITGKRRSYTPSIRICCESGSDAEGGYP